MSLRPRYSLLTLLVFTALVAGGVKLWYGPHRVVERTPGSDIEYELTFTRDWRGNRIVDGPVVTRTYLGKKLFAFRITYCRKGQSVDWTYGCDLTHLFSEDTESAYPLNQNTQRASPLSDEERLVFQQVRDVEFQRLPAEFRHFAKTHEGVLHGTD